jgi:hypothetical protein
MKARYRAKTGCEFPDRSSVGDENVERTFVGHEILQLAGL